MSVNGQFTGITGDDLAIVGDRFEVPAARSIVGQVLDAVDSWTEHADAADVGPAARAEVAADISSMSARLR
jgi:hypothetical protein